MGIERYGMGPSKTLHDLAASVCEREEAAVRCVDVEPHVLVAGHVGQPTQIVNGPGVDSPRVADNENGCQLLRPVTLNLIPQEIEVDTKTIIRGDRPKVRRWEPR